MSEDIHDFNVPIVLQYVDDLHFNTEMERTDYFTEDELAEGYKINKCTYIFTVIPTHMTYDI